MTMWVESRGSVGWGSGWCWSPLSGRSWPPASWPTGGARTSTATTGRQRGRPGVWSSSVTASVSTSGYTRRSPRYSVPGQPSPHSNCMSCSSGQRLSRVWTRPHRPWGEWREESLHRECGPLRGRHHSPLHGAEGELLTPDTKLTVWPGEVQGAAHLHHWPQHGRHDSAEVSPQTPGILLRHDPQRASCHPRASGHA